VRRPGILGGVLAIYLGTFVFLRWIFPYAAQYAVGHHAPLPMPHTLLVWSMVLLAIALGAYVLSSTANTEAFFAPLRAAIRREGPRWAAIAIRVAGIAIPVLIGAWVFVSALPRTAPPAATRQQHPGTSGPSAAPYVGLTNPFRDLPPEEREAALARGRGLYFMSCAPCHGAKHDGEGPEARAQSLRPVSFRDPGTIATLVEDAVFWRVNEGAPGLPPVSTPWDSAMPAWHGDLTADEMWAIILSEYDDADVEPRVTGMQ